jgi:hypothetical protein
MILQLNPQIPLDTDLGPGRAILVIDYSEEDHLYWVVILDKDGSIWTLDNTRVRGQKNITLGRIKNGNESIGS